MVKVAPVRLHNSPRIFWFDPGDFTLEANQNVIVETARGIEFATMADGIIEVPDEAVEALSSPLKSVVRLATDEDETKVSELDARASEALPVFRELARAHCPDMHPIAVEFLLDESKGVFYFESEERVDFRTLVRELAGTFHIRVDMHQIGARDKARMVGGLGHCGQVICCRRLGGQFNPVSIRMAKDQDLSLNPQKISGLCGRLMCCLRYESEFYKDFKSRAPKLGATVKTPDGPAKVTSLDALKEIVTLTPPDEPAVKVPLSAFAAPEEGARPKVVSEEGWREALESSAPLLAGQFVGGTVDLSKVKPKKKDADKGDDEETAGREKSGRRRNRRRSHRSEGDEAERTPRGKGSSGRGEGGKGGARSSRGEKATPTRRKRAKGERRTEAAGEGREKTNEKTQRRARRRTTITQGAEGETAPTEGARKGRSRSLEKTPRKEGAPRANARPRPGRRSSGLRAPSGEGDGGAKGAE